MVDLRWERGGDQAEELSKPGAKLQSDDQIELVELVLNRFGGVERRYPGKFG